MSCLFPDLIQEIVQRNAKHEYLKDLTRISSKLVPYNNNGTYRIHVAHVPSIHKTSGFEKRDFGLNLAISHVEGGQNFRQRSVFGEAETI